MLPDHPHPNPALDRSLAGRSARTAFRESLMAVASALLLTGCFDKLGAGSQTSANTDPSSTAASTRQRPLAAALNPAGWVAVTEPNDALLQGLNIPADAPTRGMWSGVGNWPMLGLHQAVLPNGKVLTWGTTPDGLAQNGRTFDLWDPNLGLFNAAAHQTSTDPNRQDSFCAPSVLIGDGRLMITGGNSDAGTANQTYTRRPTASRGRLAWPMGAGTRRWSRWPMAG
jgi:hypothetical protein